jgi:hypothetical protein
MPLTPVTGQTAVIRTVVGNSNTSLAAINWTLNIDAKAKDVSNSRDGRFRVKTLQDSTVSCTVVHDGSTAAYLAANGSLIDGQVMTIYCYTNTNAYFTVPAIITNVNPKSEGVEGVVMIDIQAAQHNGTITYPAT